MNTEPFWRAPFGTWIELAVDWVVQVLGGFFDVVRIVLEFFYDALNTFFNWPPFWVMIILIAAFAFMMKGWKLAVGSIIGLFFIYFVDQWANAMSTLSLVLVASALALIIAIPVGIWAAKSSRASQVIRPVLDFLQTMPAMVYLIPALILFGVGPVPGIFATVLFAVAPGVRMTELGIRGVDSEVVEAGYAFGATPGRILRQVQLPLAMPSIMAGVNQVIMLSLSMVVSAGMVGAGGLGQQVTSSLGTADVALGFEAGMSVVILAMMLDRITGSIGKSRFSGLWGKIVAIAVIVAIVIANLIPSLSAGAGPENGDEAEVTIGVFTGWPEGEAVSELWKAILEEKGYTVNLEYVDAVAGYIGLSQGRYDLLLDTWLPITHKEYVEEYGDQINQLGAWNDEAVLTFAVNSDAPIDSIDELADHADEFGNTIYGIEPGAGLTAATKDNVIPTYGLEGMNYVTSSTPAMLSELKSAMNSGENVVVTLWRPHWAYDEYDIKDLEDPEGTLGETESIYSFSSQEFPDTHPNVTQWITDFKMDSETLYSLENAMFNEYDGNDYGPIVDEWIDENQEYVDSLTAE
jgi:glycine betaine/proline transport system substrate-binding protein